MFDKKIIYFFAIVEEGSFSSAAKRLFISQPALSYQISLLEEDLGVRLFNREKNRAVVNETGKYFYSKCKPLYHEYKKIFSSIKRVPQNEIRIGFTGAFENRDLLELISRFKEHYSNAVFSFIKKNFEESAQDLIDNNVDVSFGIESTYKNLSKIHYDKLFDYEICAICSYKNPLAQYDEISIKDLKDYDFILLSKAFGKQFFKDMISGFKKSGFEPKIKKEVDSFDELIFHVSSNDGIGLAAPEVIRSDELKTVKLRDSYHQSTYVIAYRDIRRNSIVSDFIEFSKVFFESIK